MKYEYSYVLWPSEEKGRNNPEERPWSRAMFQAFDQLKCRLCSVPMTEEEFDEFRNELAGDDISLREVERVPYHEPESVK